MALTREQVMDEAKSLADRLHRFIQSKPAKHGEDFGDIVDLMELRRANALVEELQFSIFKRDYSLIEKHLSSIAEALL